MFFLITSSKLSRQFEFSLNVKVMGANPAYLLKSFLLYTQILQLKSLKVRSLALKWNRMNKPLSHVFRIFYQNIEVLKTNILFSRFNWWDCFHFRFSNVKNSEKGNKCSTKCWNTKIKMWGETYIFHSSPSFSNSYLWILFSWLWALHLCEIKFII